MTDNSLYSHLISLLDKHEAKYRLIDHQPEGRTEIVSPMRGNKLSQAAKCMVLAVQTGKKDIKYVLGVIPGDKKIDFEAVKTIMKASYVSFAPAQIAEELSGSVVGTVLPFSFNSRLELLVDPILLENEELFFNAARLDRSLALNSKDYITIVKPRLESIAQKDNAQKPQTQDAQSLDQLRHSCAHLLAAAVMELWPETKRTIGPPIENGFYYDFDFAKPISENDLKLIEKKMKSILTTWKGFERKEVTKDEALEVFAGNEYKIELIKEFSAEGQTLTLFTSGNYTDLCRGGHAQNPSKTLQYFKLMSIAGAYWRGNEKNKMLTRIYGTCFPTKEELNHYLWMRTEAKKRDHKKLGKELDLYIIPEELGPGLLIWTPKGATLRREIERFIVDEQIKRGYLHVNSPHIGKKSLWQTSGHWDLYRDKMYSPIKIDEDEYLVKPMNCPMHMMVYKSHQRSYRDLPIRIAENATVYRYEQAGELSGMTRVRYITQDDSHIFCRKDQVIDEFLGVLDYIIFLLKAFQIKDYSFRLSLRDPKNKDKYLGDDALWKRAESEIETAIKKVNLPYDKKEGEAAFYGPKLDVMIRDALGRKWQCGTIQIDFMLPGRFKLEYINEKGEPEQPALIHRAPLGSLERFTGILIEHFAGKFPLWLSPDQIVVIPIADRHLEYSKRITEKLREKNIRVDLNDKQESMQSKIRDATLQKVPYMGIIGDKELSLGNPAEGKFFISLRNREGKDFGPLELQKVLEKLQTEIEKKL